MPICNSSQRGCLRESEPGRLIRVVAVVRTARATGPLDSVLDRWTTTGDGLLHIAIEASYQNRHSSLRRSQP